MHTIAGELAHGLKTDAAGGAGAEVRSVTGITVFSGMLGVTLFGLFLTPVFYVALRKLAGGKLVRHDKPGSLAAHSITASSVL
jgi:multidrug efflux pump